MRSLLLASAAFIMTAGVALAQTTPSSPAPTGAPNAATASPSPGASPGNMAPNNGATGAAMAPSSGDMSSSAKTAGATPPAATGGMTTGAPATAATQPHYNGQDSVSPPAGQASAAGSSTAITPPAQYAASGTHGYGQSHTMMYAGGTKGLPANADPATYLRIASRAITQHNKMLADEALSHAETRMLDRAVPASVGATADTSPGITAIEQARQALQSGDYETASSDTQMAMRDHHRMMGGQDMSGGSDMAPTSGSPDAGAMGGPAQ